MNLDNLKSNWQQRNHELADSSRLDEMASHMLSRLLWFDRIILRRDLIEAVAALFVIAMFSMGFWLTDVPLIRAGSAVVILGAVEIIAVMKWARQGESRPQHNLPLAEFCSVELNRIEKQIWLGRNINWWYSAPVLLGCFLIAFGTAVSWIICIINCGIFLAVGWFVYSLNQRAVRDELVPLHEEISAIRSALMEDSSIAE